MLIPVSVDELRWAVQDSNLRPRVKHVKRGDSNRHEPTNRLLMRGQPSGQGHERTAADTDP